MTGERAVKWVSVEITVRFEAAEAIEFALNSLEALGTSSEFRRVGQTGSLTVSGYFNELPDPLVLQDELQYALRSYGFDMDAIASVENSEIEDADWLAEWKKHWRPTSVGRFIIAPPWALLEKTEKIVVRIEPNMAFGTGTHETTQLCIEAIERLYEPGDSLLDVGTGTGILAIAAAKLFVAKQPDGERPNFLAIDNDPDSVKIARENADANAVPFIEFAEGTLAAVSSRFDMVLANLTIDVILPILDALLATAGKTLILSGILTEQEHLIIAALAERGKANFRVERLGEWISVTVGLA